MLLSPFVSADVAFFETTPFSLSSIITSHERMMIY